MVKLQQCSLNFYSSKLHSLYYYCHITKLPTTILSTSKLLPSIFDVVNKKNKVNPPPLSMAQQHATSQVKISLGGTTRNHLK